MDLGKPQKRLRIDRDAEQLPAPDPSEAPEPVTAPDDAGA
jgi:hypothetical protein